MMLKIYLCLICFILNENVIKSANVDNVILTFGTDLIPKYILKIKNLMDTIKKNNSTFISDSILSWDEFINQKKTSYIKPFFEKDCRLCSEIV